jgi:aspartate kinase
VGKLQNMVGIAGRMFTTLAQGDVNIYMISQGSSEINISCVIAGQDAVKALNLIHQSCLQIKPEGAKGRSESQLYRLPKSGLTQWLLHSGPLAFLRFVCL